MECESGLQQWMRDVAWTCLGALLAGWASGVVGSRFLLKPLTAQAGWSGTGLVMAESRVLELVFWGIALGAASGACLARALRVRWR